MMNILIYDDNLKDIEHLLFCLNGLFQKTNLDYQTHICKSKTEVIQNISKADLLFLDMEIHNEKGIDLGLELNTINHNCRIVITTSYSKYAIDGYKIHADRYFIKPINQLEFNLEMRAVIKKYIKKSVSIYDDKISPYKIFVQDIVSAKLYSVPKKDDQIIFDLIVLYSKLFFYLFAPWHEPVNLFWMLNDINLRHYLQYVFNVVKGIKPICFSCLNQAEY